MSNPISSSDFIKLLKKQQEEQKQKEEAQSQSPDSYNKDVIQRLDRIEKDTLKQDKHHDPRTRSELTMKFVVFFFSLIGASYIFVLMYNEAAVTWMIRLKETGLEDSIKGIALLDFQAVISLIISGLGTSLGFIIGYYFKDKNSN
ncbi:hypothetical protein VCHENC01_0612 [Vibrio harveyi]|uniref:hypothetical protein n=1 Tax=Vibrio harveyi TaxID=669 RepID=UPI00028E772A|nr:hypothetical protein [Vibrio harveyi]EKM15203.1 hypothetical protein VCHENC01_0612 [Vibrio harveyi]